ncbi:hypothetical protein TEA_011573 [Camellia sinensis var. sinensis]|uniref:Serine-threonine/tyrosine-protein kinase catalytic domain-containing protein n=1 Tax=Camellia sinensis var. sinensis TaxID=542762 RepID=A0A4S4D2Z6_CAMSN|nr:hypothetical protein TEA_011573 [Camellia sinensis var. sinensis]
MTRNARKISSSENGGFLLQHKLSSNDGSEKIKLFNSKELEKATDHYHEDRILGQGGQGTVYKGMLSVGRIIVVKKSKVVDEGQVEQFIKEVVILSQIVQMNIRTFGYLDLEYFQSSQFTDKSDVCSFRVVIVELLTRQKPISFTRTQERKSLVSYFMQSIEENHLLEILDPRILKEGQREEMIVVAHLARRCLNLNRKKRPTMKDVAVELEGIRMSHGSSTIHQHYEEVEYNATDLIGDWDVASTSIGTFLDSSAASTFEVQSLLHSKS